MQILLTGQLLLNRNLVKKGPMGGALCIGPRLWDWGMDRITVMFKRESAPR